MTRPAHLPMSYTTWIEQEEQREVEKCYREAERNGKTHKEADGCSPDGCGEHYCACLHCPFEPFDC